MYCTNVLSRERAIVLGEDVEVQEHQKTPKQSQVYYKVYCSATTQLLSNPRTHTHIHSHPLAT